MELLDDHQQTSVRFYYDLKTLRNIMFLCIGVSVFILLVRILFILITRSYMSALQQGNIDDFMWYANSVDMLEVVSVVIVALSFIPFFMWLYRAYFNLEHVKQKGLNVTAGWAVGWFFIPIVNIFYYDVLILNDLMKGTQHLASGLSPRQDMSRTPVAPMGILWLLFWIFSGIIGKLAEKNLLSESIDGFKMGLIQEIVSDVLLAASGVVIFYIVFFVSKKQTEIASNEIVL